MKADDAEKKLKISDAAKVVAAKWRLMSDEEKVKWKREKPAVVEEGAEGSGGVGGMVVGVAGMAGVGMMPGLMAGGIAVPVGMAGGIPGITPATGAFQPVPGGMMGSVGGVVAPPPSGQPAPPPSGQPAPPPFDQLPTIFPAPPK